MLVFIIFEIWNWKLNLSIALKVLLTLPEQLAREDTDVKGNKDYEIRGIHPTEFFVNYRLPLVVR